MTISKMLDTRFVNYFKLHLTITVGAHEALERTDGNPLTDPMRVNSTKSYMSNQVTMRVMSNSQ